ncbi:hypothetical protein BABINDRAFT_161823 [Babjeviella inositovora NRRL Y-12698]|uniref:Cation/H+ exchanger domain-containing protein n=1 Tax=Babjeviella inositovora NRRL Y-12698 TaxID=984486 RepID=A0A1E3QP05_9ASCO|nr:uncharacterized protein BABINDRAFT_161823 [Babjeviella inositovora NRRL Y-12698]ODQ79423.1 hypothetical protein BABINDRAFT_161823 [Babjeviella inositovora NRRL Y-12698]
MTVWDQLEVDKVHVAYAIIGVCTTLFATFSLFLKEKLFIGEATASTLAGIIVGPHSLNWFSPTGWGNFNYITQEVSRIVLIIQIFAVSVELPKKYMKKHCLSVMLCLFFGMTFGWLIMALFIWVLFARLNFADALLISGCITATDPVLAAAIVGKGKFGQRVPAHLRNLLSAESGANDGMAFPFVLLASQLVLRYGHTGEIIKNWFCVAVLYECVFGVILGVLIGYGGRQLIKFCEKKNLIDRESFLVFYILLSLMCTGFGSILGVDDLLVAFAAGAAFAWDGWFARKTEESNLSNIVDLLLNMGYFMYFGASIPWTDFNNAELGLECWRLVLLGLVAIFLKRIPIFLAIKPITPDLRSWKEAFFCGHFGPIGVGGLFCSMIALSALEKPYTSEETPTAEIPDNPHAYLMRVIWPVVTFLVVCSVIVHGSSVTVMTLKDNVKHMRFAVKNPQLESPSGTTTPTVTASGVERVNRQQRSSRNDPFRALQLIPVGEAVKLLYDDEGHIRRPENIYVQGNSVVVEDRNGEVIDEFYIQEEAAPTILNTLRRLLHIEDSAPHHDVNVDERNNRLKWINIDKQVLTAYKVGNEIIVENDNEEIIRRYVVTPRWPESETELQDLELNQLDEDIYPAADPVNNQHASEYDEQEIRHHLKGPQDWSR